jgi:hypothetical protein
MVVVIGVAGWLGYVLVGQKDKPEGTRSLLELITHPNEWGKTEESPITGEKPIQETGGKLPDFVMSYGVIEGVEKLLVKGRILQWGETWVEMETQNRQNYPLLLPEKMVHIRCLPHSSLNTPACKV